MGHQSFICSDLGSIYITSYTSLVVPRRHFVDSLMRQSLSQVLSAADFYRNIIAFDKISPMSTSPAGGSFRYSSIFSQLPEAGEARRDLLNSVKLKTQLWYFQCSYTYSRGIKELTCKLTLDPNLLSI